MQIQDTEVGTPEKGGQKTRQQVQPLKRGHNKGGAENPIKKHTVLWKTKADCGETEWDSVETYVEIW